jgi:hypothetical protein
VIAAVVTLEIKIILMPNSMLTWFLFSLNSPHQTKMGMEKLSRQWCGPGAHNNNCCIQGKREENVQQLKTFDVPCLTKVFKNSSTDINCFKQGAASCLISIVSINISRTWVIVERPSRLTSCCKVSDHIPDLCHFPVCYYFLPEIREEEVLGCTSYCSLLLKKPNIHHR